MSTEGSYPLYSTPDVYVNTKTSVVNSKESERNVQRDYDSEKFLAFRQNFGDLLITLAKEDSRYKSIADLQRDIARDPIYFLQKHMRRISPFASKVINASLVLAFQNNDYEIIVYDESDKVDEVASKELEELFDNQPPDVGDLIGICTKLLLDYMYFGRGCCFEGVTSPEKLGGYSRIYPFSSNTLELGKQNPDGSEEFGFYQEQYEDGALVQRKLSTMNIYWSPYQPTTFRPEGTSAIPSAALEVFGEAITRRDLKDGIQNAGSPTHVFKFDSAEFQKTAVEKLKKRGTEISNYVQGKIQELKEYAAKYRSTDNAVIDAASDLERIKAGDFGGLEPAIQMIWTALSASLNSFPELLGFGDTTKTNIQYQMFAGSVSSGRSKVVELLEKFGERHFRLRGKIRRVEVVLPTIHLTDELIIENTFNMKIMNRAVLLALGAITEDEFSIQLTGTKAQKPIDMEVLKEVIKATGTTDKNGSKQTGKDNTQISGGKPGKSENV